MMSKRTVFTAVVVLVGSSLTSHAQTERLAVAGMGGTLGLGGELMVRVLSDVNVRVGAGAFNIEVSGKYADIAYDFDTDLLTFPIRVDWYPFKNSFHVSSGIIVNRTKADLHHRNGSTVTIGGTPYPLEDVGTLAGHVDFNKVAPYMGIGWGNAFGKSKRWGFVSDLGVAYTGSANITLSATGVLASNPSFQTSLDRERADLQSDLDNFKFVPVLTASLFFRF